MTICVRRDITVSIVKASSTLLCVLVSMMLLAINSLILYYGHVERERLLSICVLYGLSMVLLC